MTNTKNIKKLRKPPIVDAGFEIRFESNYSPNMVPVYLMKALSDLNLKDVESLQGVVHDSITATALDLQYAPHYKARIDPLVIQFGARMIALSSPLPYIGWDNFFLHIKKVLKKILDTDPQIIIKIDRLGQRGINFFEIDDIIPESNYKINRPIAYDNTQYQYTDLYIKNNINIRTIIANKAKFQAEKIIKFGSIIDIDASIEKNIILNYDEIINIIDKLHSECKEVFFNMLGENLLESLEPEYGYE